ncbi:MAG: hypothetical protein AAF431_13950 [Pseudomonadota bacterium]
MKQTLCLAILLISSLLTSNSIACESLLFSELAPLSRNQATAQLNEILLSDQLKATNADQTLEQQLQSIRCYLQVQANQDPRLGNSGTELQGLADALINADTAEARREAISAINQAVNRDAGTGFLLMPLPGADSLELDLFSELINFSCDEEPASSCSEAFSTAAHLWWIAGVYRGLADQFNQSDVVASQAFNQRLEKKWLSYKDDTILLWPQEVLLNSLVFRQNKRGFTEPPAYKLLSLRPSIGLSYLSDADHHLQPTLNVDLLGLYWWRYGGADGSEAQPGRGIAASMILDGSDHSYGFTYYHNPKWSVTLASGSKNDVVLSVSMQLTHWLLGQ